MLYLKHFVSKSSIDIEKNVVIPTVFLTPDWMRYIANVMSWKDTIKKSL